MKAVARFVLAAALVLVFALVFGRLVHADSANIPVVAAESAYGDIARAIGGDRVVVTSILANPAQDPHLFEATPTVVRQTAAARLVIVNGADYDPWVDKLLSASPRPGRVVISAAALLHRKAGDNPHLWYDPATMPAVATAIAGALAGMDPAHAAEYAARLAAVRAALARIDQRVAAMKASYAGTPITATEPVFGLLTDAIGLENRNRGFQRAVMNDTEPSARDLAAMERDLRERKVKVLIDNRQVTDKLTQRLHAIAAAAGVPVVGVTETLPAGMDYVDWVLGELDALDKALSRPKS